MNERIQELAEQAKDWKRGNGCMDYQAVDLEKFAELIVKECIAQCEKNSEHSYLGPGSKLSAFNIKEYFGVKK